MGNVACMVQKQAELDEAALVEALAEVFAEQIAAWREAGRIGVPLLALDDALSVRRGR